MFLNIYGCQISQIILFKFYKPQDTEHNKQLSEKNKRISDLEFSNFNQVTQLNSKRKEIVKLYSNIIVSELILITISFIFRMN